MANVVAAWPDVCPGCEHPRAIFLVTETGAVSFKCPRCGAYQRLNKTHNWENVSTGGGSSGASAIPVRRPF